MLLYLMASLMLGCTDVRVKDYSTSDFSVIKLADGVFACIHKPGGKAIGNAGIVDNGEATIVFDTFLSPDAAEELTMVVEQMQLSPIRYVVNSHFDNDHVRGNQCFPSDVKILSTERTAQLIKEEEPKAIAEEKIYAKKLYEYYDSLDRAFTGDTASGEYMNIKMMKPYFEELSQSHLKITTRIPDTYVKGEMSLDGPAHRVLLIEKGKGHSESDLVMYLPEEGILFAGDLVFNEAHPWLGYGYTEELKARLTELEVMQPQIVVPGHGDPGGVETIITTRDYIEEIERIAKELTDAGDTAEDIDKVPMPDKYRDWIIGNYFYSNLRYMVDKMKGPGPDSATAQ
jgi:glyoxylase-like metal-dependent hydrolase (beta-lactamase superfamily II)